MTDPARRIAALLDAEASAGRTVTLWWRDDDAVRPGPALDRLLGFGGRHAVPLALAVIPAGATGALANEVARRPRVHVLQHGFAHINHEPPGAKAAELGAARDTDLVLAELAAGRTRLTALFGDRFLPVLVPPWNRAADTVIARRAEAGLPGLSMFGGHGHDGQRADAHLDPIFWRGDRLYVGDDRALAMLASALAAARGSPVGLLTHHRDHDAATWRFVETLLTVAVRHPAIRFPPIAEIFSLPGDRPPPGAFARA